jgi:3-keto-disaccharide hydrolase
MTSLARALLIALPLLACSCDATKEGDVARKEAPTKAEQRADAESDARADAKADAKPDPKADATAGPDADKASRTWSFDDETPGAVAAGFTPTQTGEKADPPATWAIVADPEAPSPPHVFGVTKTVGVNKTFNNALIEGTSFKDFELTVMLRPVSGANNQGGGVMFRAKGVDDHYIARWNPVENNVRIYALLGGARVDIAAAPLELDPKVWHQLKVTVAGDRIETFVDDKPIVQANDKSLADAGMIGLWTKGDAATLFDDLTITPE